MQCGETAHICAYTHAAARLVGGVTVAHILKLDAKLHNSWITIDEISRCPIDTLGQLVRIHLARAKVVLLGDFERQFEPMKDRWDAKYSLVPESTMLRDMCGHLHIHLSEYMRGTDNGLFKFSHGRYQPDDTLPESVDKARAAYPVRALSPFDVDAAMCISHAARQYATLDSTSTKRVWQKPPASRLACSTGTARTSRAQRGNHKT